MICDRCKKREATTYLKTNINGVVTEKHLCSECARFEDMGERNYVNTFFDDFFSPSFDFGFSLPFEPAFGFAYPNRGNSILEQAKRSIKVGADRFKKEMESHPNALKIQGLKSELNEAVEKEDYEKASRLKKEIEDLQKGDKNE